MERVFDAREGVSRSVGDVVVVTVLVESTMDVSVDRGRAAGDRRRRVRLLRAVGVAAGRDGEAGGRRRG